MNAKLPTISKVKVALPTTIHVSWHGGGATTVDLAGWIGGGNPILAPLKDPAVFADAKVAGYGSMIAWGDPDGDLVIDGIHIRLLAAEQAPFGAAELISWQGDIRMSNAEAAEFLGVGVSAFNRWKAGEVTVPTPVAIACRAALRDPIVKQAHFRPKRPAGRPRKDERTGLRFIAAMREPALGLESAANGGLKVGRPQRTLGQALSRGERSASSPPSRSRRARK